VGDAQGALAGVRIDDSTSRRIAAAAGPARAEGSKAEAGTDEVDPALIARLIQGVKDL
jgi:hypothetical protein